ncbi:MAG TPA: helix-turn-helix domain-containing protein [Syntrophomonas sp.]|nr:helix-turn-helix domain-containing protein [Syntrophomonas sp.]
MEIKQILEQLQNYQPKVLAETKTTCFIHAYKIIKPGQKNFNPACIYVGYVSELTEAPGPDSSYNLICIEDAPLPQTYLNENAENNLFLIPSSTMRDDLLNSVADIMDEEATLISGMRRILDALYANRGLQNLVDVASEIFENPIIISDTAYKFLARTQKTVFEDSALEEEKELGYINETNMASLKQYMIFERAHQTNEIVSAKRPGTDETWMFHSVKIHDITVADIAIVDNNRPFRETDHELLYRFSEMAAIEMEKNDFFESNKGVMFNYFLADLLSGKLKSPKAVEQRSRYLNWKFFAWFQVVAVIDHREALFGNKVQQIGALIRKIVPDCHWTFFEKNLVVLVSRPNYEILKPKEMESLEDYLRDNGLSAGFSNSFSDIMDALRFYKQALRAVETGVFVSRGRGVFHYSDMMVFYAAKSLAKHDNLEEFCPAAVTTLQDYDARHGTLLLETLEKYLLYVGNPVAAAKALNIHRNTLLYRINKIKELAQIDLDNGDERLKIQLYLKFLEYQKGGW